jgi:5-hydroxyisourate hydrolase
MGNLTTHVLNTAQGIPAAGMRVHLWRIADGNAVSVASGRTNADGRLPSPLLEGEAFSVGTYELSFAVSSYFSSQPVTTSDPPFLDIVTIRFTISDEAAHYHVPLLVSPWAYSTYRGS